MEHTKSFILSEDTKNALDYLYREIESLEEKVNDLDDRLYKLERERRE